MLDIYRILTEIQHSGDSAAMCIITETHGSTPLKAGSKMIVLKNKKTFGTVGGGNLEYRVIEDAITVIENNTPQIFKHLLVQDHQMCCGGTVNIYIEPILKVKNLFVFGAGHIAKEIVRYAKPLDFQIHIIDERKNLIQNIQEHGITIHQMHHSAFLSQLPFNNDSYIVICTHLHQYDREILTYCISKSYAYLGMIGSQRKIAVTKNIFLKNKIAAISELDKVDMPMGIDIGANGPAEIALSIVAKLIAVKNNREVELKTDKTRNTLMNETHLKQDYAKTDSNSKRCW
jgi:xanthine dehydrogenase accessory factor